MGPRGSNKILKNAVPSGNLRSPGTVAESCNLVAFADRAKGTECTLDGYKERDVTKHQVKVRFGDILKTTRPGFQQKEVTIKAYAPNRRLCIVTVLTEYLERTKPLRQSTGLFLSAKKPYGRASRDTISRWVKAVMEKAGLDLNVFTPHSV